jgi:hypothetical protein
VYQWLGDILDSKVFQDSEYLMRIIEKADAACLLHRYRPSLNCIIESDECDDDKSKMNRECDDDKSKSKMNSIKNFKEMTPINLKLIIDVIKPTMDKELI